MTTPSSSIHKEQGSEIDVTYVKEHSSSLVRYGLCGIPYVFKKR